MTTATDTNQPPAAGNGPIREIATCHGYGLATGLVGLGLIPGLISSFEETFALSHSWMGAILAAGAALFCVLAIVFGLIADHRGYRIVLIVSTALIAVCAAMLWQSPTRILAIAALLLFNACMGNYPLINSLVFSLYGEKSAKGMNLIHGIEGVGRLLAPLLIALMIALTQSWRSVFCVTMIVFLILLVPVSVIRKSAVAGPIGGTSLKESLRILKVPQVLLGVLTFVFLTGCENMFINWIANYLETECSLSRRQGLLGLTVMMTGFTGVRLFLGLVHLEFTAGWVLGALAMVTACYGGLALASSPWLIYGICFVLGAAMGPSFPMTANLLLRVLPGGRGLLTGLFFLGGNVGVMVFVSLAGVLGDIFSLRVAFAVAPASYAIFAAILIFFLKKKRDCGTNCKGQ